MRRKLLLSSVFLAVRFVLAIILVGGLTGCLGSKSLSQATSSLFQKGNSYTAKAHMTSDLVMMFPDVDHKETDLVFDCQVTEIDEQGNAVVEVTIESVKVLLKTLGGIKLTYDSEAVPDDQAKAELDKTGKSKDAKRQTYIKAFAGLKGKKYTAVVDPRGVVVKLVDVDKEIQKALDRRTTGKMLGGDQVEMLFTAASLKEYAWPGHIIAAGDPEDFKFSGSWRGTGTVVVPYTTLVNLQKTSPIKSESEHAKEFEAVLDKASTVFLYDMAHVGKGEDLSGADQAKPKSGKKRRRSYRGSTKYSFVMDKSVGIGRVTLGGGSGSIFKLEEKMKIFVKTKGGGSKRKKPNIYYLISRTIEIVDN